MNLETVFNFIKEKKGYDYPFVYKLINGLELTEDDLNVDGDLDLSGTEITSLPDNLKVGGTLNLHDTNITSLPDNLYVSWNFYLNNTNITSLPNNLYVGGYLYLNNTPLSRMYYRDSLRKMIEYKGGSVGGTIVV